MYFVIAQYRESFIRTSYWFMKSQQISAHSVKLSASFCYLSGSEPYRGFRNMQSLLGQTVCYR